MSFKVTLFTRGQQSHSYEKEIAFLEGLQKHNVKCNIETRSSTNYNCDLGIMWGVRYRPVFKAMTSNNKNLLVLENSYIDRDNYTSCGFNGLNGRADFVADNVPDDRVKLFSHHLKDYRLYSDGYILVMGQIPSDASVRHVNYYDWLDSVFSTLKLMSIKDCFYRPHPLDVNPYIPDGVKVIQSSLKQALNDARCVITFNSNSGVDAVLNGNYCISLDKGSMVWDVTKHNFVDILEPEFIDREQWLKKISYSQWTLEEMRRGLTWDHLRQYYERGESFKG